MNKDQVITFIFTIIVSITTGFVTGTVIVTKIQTDVSWVMKDISDHEHRIRKLEERVLYDSK